MPFNHKSSRRHEQSVQEDPGKHGISMQQPSVDGPMVKVTNSMPDDEFYSQRSTLKKGKKGQKESTRVPLQMSKQTFDRIIYPVQTKRGLKYPKKKPMPQMGGHVPQDLVQNSMELSRKNGKLLDGFLILYSCRVKLPHEAIKSKLDSQNIMEVIEEDLCYFQNLTSIDLSDNHIRLEQLRNLKSLTEINLQYNYIRVIPSLATDDFERVETLNLSFNSLTPASIRSLYTLKKLKSLDLQANNLVTLPEDVSRMVNLEELNLSSNQFSSGSSLVNPSLLTKAIGQIPKLKRLNLSRNKFQAFHGDMLQKDSDFL